MPLINVIGIKIIWKIKELNKHSFGLHSSQKGRHSFGLHRNITRRYSFSFRGLDYTGAQKVDAGQIHYKS